MVLAQAPGPDVVLIDLRMPVMGAIEANLPAYD